MELHAYSTLTLAIVLTIASRSIVVHGVDTYTPDELAAIEKVLNSKVNYIIFVIYDNKVHPNFDSNSFLFFFVVPSFN